MNCKYTVGNTCSKGYSFESKLCLGEINLVKLDKEFTEANDWMDESDIEERNKKHSRMKELMSLVIRMYACNKLDRNEVYCDFMVPYVEGEKNPFEYGECVVESEKTKSEMEAYLFILQNAIEKISLKRRLVQMSINTGQSYGIDYSRIL